MTPVDSRQRFAVNLRRCRQHAGISQERLGFKAKLHRTEISLLQRGEREPRLTTIVPLARAQDVEAADLLDGFR